MYLDEIESYIRYGSKPYSSNLKIYFTKDKQIPKDPIHPDKIYDAFSILGREYFAYNKISPDGKTDGKTIINNYCKHTPGDLAKVEIIKDGSSFGKVGDIVSIYPSSWIYTKKREYVNFDINTNWNYIKLVPPTLEEYIKYFRAALKCRLSRNSLIERIFRYNKLLYHNNSEPEEFDDIIDLTRDELVYILDLDISSLSKSEVLYLPAKSRVEVGSDKVYTIDWDGHFVDEETEKPINKKLLPPLGYKLLPKKYDNSSRF